LQKVYLSARQKKMMMTLVVIAKNLQKQKQPGLNKSKMVGTTGTKEPGELRQLNAGYQVLVPAEEGRLAAGRVADQDRHLQFPKKGNE
jgi:hypothetical protein